jgi:hypothetical protein
VVGGTVIDKKGYYKDINDKIWYWDGWSNQPVITLVSDKEERVFNRDGNCLAQDELNVVVEYLSEENYPEYYI